MIKTNYLINGQIQLTDAGMKADSYVLKENTRIDVNYNVYINEAAYNEGKQPIDQYIHRLGADSEAFETAQAAILSTIENLADNGVIAKEEFAGATILSDEV